MSRYRRIRKNKARELFNEGREIILVGDNVNEFHFFSGWHLATTISKARCADGNFDAIVRDFEFYLDRELGRRAAYYLR